MSASIELQKQTIVCLQEIKKEIRKNADQKNGLGELKRELFKMLLADPQATNSGISEGQKRKSTTSNVEMQARQRENSEVEEVQYEVDTTRIRTPVAQDTDRISGEGQKEMNTATNTQKENSTIDKGQNEIYTTHSMAIEKSDSILKEGQHETNAYRPIVTQRQQLLRSSSLAQQSPEEEREMAVSSSSRQQQEEKEMKRLAPLNLHSMYQGWKVFILTKPFHHWLTNQSKIDTSGSRRLVTCLNDHLRDIEQPKGHNRSIRNSMATLIAQLSSGSKKKKLASRVIEDQYNSAYRLGGNMHAHMLAFIAKSNNKSIHAIFNSSRSHWKNIPIQIQDRYSFFLERKILDNLGLNLGRCLNMWSSRILLKRATYCRTVGNKELHLRAANQHISQCDGKCEIADDDLIEMDSLPLSLLVDEEEENASGYEGSEKEESEESEEEELEEETETETPCQESDTEEEEFEREKSTSFTRLSTVKKMPVVIAAESDEDDDNSDDDSATFYSHNKEYKDENGTAASSSPTSSSGLTTNRNNKRPNNDRSVNQSKKKKGKLNTSIYIPRMD